MATEVGVTQSPPAAGPAVRGSGPAPDTGARGRRSPITPGELVSAGFALGLLALMFLARWYGVAGVPDPSAARPAVSTAVDAWNGLTIVRWVMLVTILVAVGSVVLHISQRSHGTKTDTSRLITALGSLTALLLVYRVLIALPSPDRITDQKLGAVLGLVCSLGIALGGRQAMLEHKAPAPRATAQRRRDRSAPAKIPANSAAAPTDRGRVK